jgi:hypothetical protein
MRLLVTVVAVLATGRPTRVLTHVVTHDATLPHGGEQSIYTG